MKQAVNLFIVALFVSLIISCQSSLDEKNKWQVIFDGETLEGWKKSGENPESITIENGTIKCAGDRSHLFYEENYKNFEFEAEIKAEKNSNSGIFIHTKYQNEGWPENGYEIQVNNTYNRDRRKTGSVYNIRNIYYQLAEDGEWFKMRIKVVENHIEVFVNDVKVNDYMEPAKPWRWDGGDKVKLSRGTFALQAHDPESTVFYRNIKVRELPDDIKVEEVDNEWDSVVTKLMKAGFPFIDFHVHLKGGLTIDEVVENSQKLGINYGVAPNCGLHFPVTNDSSLYAYIKDIEGSPTFKGMQAEGREWITLFSPEAIAQFDYVFTDAMTFTDYKGRRNRIWIPEEVWVDDPEQFMDQMVEKIEAIFSQEPVDIYVNPTVLPAELMDDYDKLWTQERMERVVKVLADNNIALEINARYKTPKAKMIKMAKDAGVKLAFGTNNTGRDLGQLQYCLEMIKECGIKPIDMFEIKSDNQKPVNVKGLPEKITG